MLEFIEDEEDGAARGAAPIENDSDSDSDSDSDGEMDPGFVLPEITREEAARRLKAARVAAGIPSGRAAARRLNYDQRYYNAMERGDRTPLWPKLLAVAAHLGLDPRILMPELFAGKKKPIEIPTPPKNPTPPPGTRRSRSPALDDRDWLRRRYHEDGATLRQIAAEVDCSIATVSLALRRAGLAAGRRGKRKRPWAPPPGPLADRDWLRDRYQVRDATAREIAAEAGCGVNTVIKSLRHHGIPVHTGGKNVPRLRDRDWLLEQRIARRRTLKDIGDEVGCTAEAVRLALIRLGIGA